LNVGRRDGGPGTRPFSIDNPFERRLPRLAMAAAAALLERLTGLARLDELYVREWLSRRDGASFACAALDILGITIALDARAVDAIPPAGPLVLVANHPHGALDGLAIMAALERRRPDLRLLGNRLLARIPELAPAGFFVDVFGTSGRVGANARRVREASRWVEQGGALLIFPAGEVAHRPGAGPSPAESPWHATVAHVIESARAVTVPIFIEGSNSRTFMWLGRIHPLLRTALLPRELLAARGRTVRMRLGEPIAWDRLARLRGSEARTAWLRAVTLRLGDEAGARPAGPEPAGGFPAPQPTPSASRLARIAGLAPQAARVTRGPGFPAISIRRHAACPAREPVAPPVAPDLVAADLAALPPSRCLVETSRHRVVVARARELPHALQEIGRLRELAFRAVGEGTGRRSDLDRFDADYWHLVLWHERAREIVGAYRLGPTDAVAMRSGPAGLYTRTLFRYGWRFLDALGPALELGRSFVRPEYQRDYSALLLLWKGIGRFVCRQPRYRMLFGPVSISASYRPASRDLLVSALASRRYASDLAGLVRPRRRFSPAPPVFAARAPAALALGEVDAVLKEVEPDGKGVPVLLRHYLTLGARVLAFSVDPAFSHVIDALVVVDLASVDPTLLARYMGRDEAARFLTVHRDHAVVKGRPWPVMPTA
jgi:putative hemolysin